MRAIIAVPRYLSLFPFFFYLPHFLLLVLLLVLNRSSVFALSLKPDPTHQLGCLLILGASLPVATAPCLVITGSKQEPADAAITHAVLSGEFFFPFESTQT